MKKLRIGFLLDARHCPQWQSDIIERITQTSELKICLIAFNANKKISNKKDLANKTLLSKILRPFRVAFSLINPKAYAIPSIYHRLDDKYNGQLNKSWKESHLKEISGTSYVSIQASKKGFANYFNSSDIKSIKDEKLDVLIRFGFGIIRGDIHGASQFGIWSFHHGDNRFYRGGPPGIWEIIKGKRSISVTLQRLNDQLDCGQTIGRFTHRSDLFSALKNKNIIYSSCGDLLLQKLLQTHSMGFDSISNSAIYNEQIPETKILKSPNNIETIPLFFTIFKHFIEQRWPRNKKLQWFLAIKKQDSQIANLDQTTLLYPPADRFYADPFIIENNDKTYIFLEELIYSKKKAHISVAEFNDGKLENLTPIIQEDFHLSYPFIFEDNNEWYIIPESRENKDLRLYKCSSFPNSWTLEKILISDVELLDATIHKQDDTYFLFANQYEPSRDTSNECLVVYFSKSIQGPWQPHPLNPLTTNICNSRPAGKLFFHQNKLILPTQNCALRYGYGINFNEVDISETTFSIKKVTELKPDWLKNNLGSHTWNGNDNHIVTDAHRYINR